MGVLFQSVLFGLFAVMSFSSRAASFNCEKADTKIEKMICGDAELSKLDEKLNAAYRTASSDEKQAASIKQAQRQWINDRNNCADADCVKRAYVAQLQTMASSSDTSGANPEHGMSMKTDTVEKPNSAPLTVAQKAGKECIDKATSISEQDREVMDTRLEDQEIIDVCTWALQAEPKNAAAYFYRGMSRAHQLSGTSAVEDFTKAIEINPGYAQAYYQRGVLYAVRGEHSPELLDDAIADFKKAIENAPEFTKAYQARGLAYVTLANQFSRPEESLKKYAIADFTKVIEFEPKNVQALWLRAFVYGLMQDYRHSIDDCDRLVELVPAESSHYLQRGNAYFALGDFKRAIADFTRTIELAPKDANPYSQRGEAYLKLKEFTLAIDDFSKALELFPAYTGLYFSRGLAYDALGDKEHAMADWKLAASKGYVPAKDALWNKGVK
jgi:tetratricopeptide (TPR) repeat protein